MTAYIPFNIFPYNKYYLCFLSAIYKQRLAFNMFKLNTNACKCMLAHMIEVDYLLQHGKSVAPPTHLTPGWSGNKIFRTSQLQSWGSRRGWQETHTHTHTHTMLFPVHKIPHSHLHSDTGLFLPYWQHNLFLSLLLFSFPFFPLAFMSFSGHLFQLHFYWMECALSLAQSHILTLNIVICTLRCLIAVWGGCVSNCTLIECQVWKAT